MIRPLTFEFVVECDAEHAFDTWLSRTTTWWPHEHTVSGDTRAQIIFQPFPGGRLFERTADGVEIDWGEVTVCERPTRLSYRWFIRVDRADATDVDITFTDLGDGRTRVDIEHSGWERLGEGGPGWRLVNRGGWTGVLPAYETACAR